MISKFKEVHGDRYDYSHVIYKNINTKISIKCRKHDIIFEQTPFSHMNPDTEICPSCHKESIIYKFNIIHNNKYNYSLMEYTNSKSKIKIICPEHGMFEQIPDSHMRCAGCNKCTMRNPNTIIDEFREIHGEKYDYSLVEYKNVDVKVNIICPIHGNFIQSPNHHLAGRGCIKCTVKDPIMVLDEFREIHGEKYDYSLVNYISMTTKIKILCPVHGEFNQRPSVHLQGCGCPSCALLNKHDLTERFKKVHGDKYDYSLITDKINKKVEIICNKHGVFEQRYDSHLNGNGCAKCAKEITHKEIYTDKFTILYYILINNTIFKVGLTTVSILHRYRKEISMGMDVKILREIPFTNGYEAFKLEQQILKESINRGTISKEECELISGYTEVRKNDFIDIFDRITN